MTANDPEGNHRGYRIQEGIIYKTLSMIGYHRTGRPVHRVLVYGEYPDRGRKKKRQDNRDSQKIESSI